MNWKVVTLGAAVDKELNALDPVFKAKFLHIAELLEIFGPENVREPYCKSLGNGLWEMRMRGQPGVARAIYAVGANCRLVVLHVFVKKTQKTPKKAMDLALKRLKRLKS